MRSLCLCTAFACSLAVTARAETVLVFAAASLADALAEVERGFESASGHDMVTALAGSSVLARQIQQGAPAHVFVSASSDWMDVLDNDGLLAAGTRFDLLTNDLVLIAHGRAAPLPLSANTDLVGALDGGRLAMALIDAVPAGIYGKAALETLGLWATVAGQVAQADNVRAALALVATGEAPLGIVYATDAAASADVSVVATFPADSHPPILYPVAGIAGQESAGQTALLAYLRGAEAQAIFLHHGFRMPGA